MSDSKKDKEIDKTLVTVEEDTEKDDTEDKELYERKIMTSLVLRLFVGGYFIYIAYMLIFDTASKTSSMPRWCTYLFAVLFTVIGIALFVYSVLRMKKDKKQ